MLKEGASERERTQTERRIQGVYLIFLGWWVLEIKKGNKFVKKQISELVELKNTNIKDKFCCKCLE